MTKHLPLTSVLVALSCALVGPACDSHVDFDPEGYQCDPDERCPQGYACVEGVCRAVRVVTGPGADGGGLTDGGEEDRPDGGGGSADGGSDGGVDRCARVTCAPAPEAVCLSQTEVKTYGSRCDPETGTCIYPELRTSCAYQCRNGACIDRCTGVVCTEPERSVCIDADRVRVQEWRGTCVEATGRCTYADREIVCEHGCVEGQCRAQPLCAGVVCVNPFSPTCENGVSKTYSEQGRCVRETGRCEYTPAETMCQNGCANGLCVPAGLSFAQTGPRIDFPVTAVDVAPGSQGRLVLAVGPAGRVARWEGTSWTLLASPSAVDLTAVAFVSPSTAYAVGRRGAIWLIQGTTVTPLAPFSSQGGELDGGLSGDGGVGRLLPDGGDGGTSSGGDGAALTRVDWGEVDLVAVSGRSEGSVLVAGAKGEWGRLSNGTWSNGRLPGAEAGYEMSAAWIDDAGRERIAGRCGPSPAWTSCVATRGVTGLAESSSWTIDRDAQDFGGFRAIGAAFEVPPPGVSEAWVGRSRSILAVGRAGASSFPDLTTIPVLEGGEIRGITSAEDPNRPTRLAIYVLTAAPDPRRFGHLYRLMRDTQGNFSAKVLLDTRSGGGSALSPNESSGVIVSESRRASGGTLGRSNVFRRSILEEREALELGEDWVGAWLDVEGRLVLVSARGDVAVRKDTESRTTFDFHQGPSIQALAAEARNGSGVLIVGSDGAASPRGVFLRYAPGRLGPTFTELPLPPPPLANAPLTSVCRVSDAEAWAVGSGGRIIRVSQSSPGVLTTSVVPSGVTADLESVSCPSPGVAVACGRDGTVLRLYGGAWKPISPAFPVTGRPVVRCAFAGSTLFAAGDGFLYRLDAGAAAWRPMPALEGLLELIPAGVNELYAIVPAVRAGSSDLLRFDGTTWKTLLTVPGQIQRGALVGPRVVLAGSSGVIVESR